MDHCHDEHDDHSGHSQNDGHNHSEDLTPALQQSLYKYINFDGISTLNEAVADSGRAIVKKTWTERLEIEPELSSDTDEQLILHVPFTGQVKLHSILIRSSPSPCAPRTLKVFVNTPTLDFSTAADLPPTQSFDLSRSSEVQEIPVKRSSFGRVTTLSLFFEDNFSNGDEDVTRMTYAGFKGEWTAIGKAPENIIYEAAANPNDHKVKGTDLRQVGSGL